MSAESDESDKSPLKIRPVYLMLVGAIVIVAAIAAVLAYKINTANRIALPKAIASKITFSAYVPTKLPDGYKLAQNSFSVQEGVLVFWATSKPNPIIAFSEQKKPKDSIIKQFLDEQISNTENINDLPFRTVIGQAPNGHTSIVSIVANDTWILISTDAQLGIDDTRTMAGSLAH
jgi:hypothetical protein